MGIIQQLPDEIAIKIAAGEVVERPASVVKELVENALDAGATHIEVTIEEGGKSLIAIKDNGKGMDREDASKAFLRHGTSKIRQAEDLAHVTTLGFRGEALAAIAASAEVELVTTQSDASEGSHVVVRYGEQSPAKPAAPVPGTSIRVSRLFEALPVRQKFLKSDATEWKACLDTLTKQMIVHPEVGFVVKHNQRTVYDLPATENFAERVAALWGIDVSRLIPIKVEGLHMDIVGVLAKPEVAHESKGRQFLAVNHHPVNDKMLAKGVKEAYGTLLPPGLYPAYALQLQVHPGMVDVNIHPRKDEVRFVNSQDVYRFVFQAVSQTLSESRVAFETLASLTPGFSGFNSGRDSASAVTFASERTYESTPSYAPYERRENGSSGAPAVPFLSSSPQPLSQSHLSMRSSTFEPTFARPSFDMVTPASLSDQPIAPILVVDNCFLVTLHEGKLLLIDQHAAHERILYNQLWEAEAHKQVVSQRLLLPIEVTLSPAEQAVFEEYQAIFQSLGFVLALENSTVSLFEVPALLKQQSPEAFFRAVLQSLQHDERHEPELTERKHKVFATMACKAAVKAGDSLSEAEKLRLIKDLLEKPGQFTCPHGRPSHIEVAGGELEKLFKRTGF